MSSSVITGGKSTKSLLTSGVPNLELDVLPFQADGLDFEVHTDCIEIVLVERILSVPHEEATLTYATVAYE